MPRYEHLYARGAYAPQAERERLAGVLDGARTKHPPRGTRAGAFRRNACSSALDPSAPSAPRPTPAAVQLALF